MDRNSTKKRNPKAALAVVNTRANSPIDDLPSACENTKCQEVDNIPLRGPIERLVLFAIRDGYGRPSRRRYFGSRIDFATWLGHKPTEAESSALTRALTRLERKGLALRIPGRRAVLTRTGQALAVRLECVDSTPAIDPEQSIEAEVSNDSYVERYGDPEVPSGKQPIPSPPTQAGKPRLKLSELQRAKLDR